MSQTIYDTRQRAEELLKEALRIWKQSNHSEYLEGLEKDPVFGLLMSAIAWQANETDNQIVRLRTEILDEYLAMLTPYEVGHATPATAVIQTRPQTGVGEVWLNSRTSFTLGKGKWRFMPLLKTRVLGANIDSVIRLDGRRWAVNLSFNQPVTDLSGMTFAILNPSFRDVVVTLAGKELPLIRPWEYSELPFSDCFSLDHSLYNRMSAYDPAPSCMELFARHDLRLYCIREHNPVAFIPQETQHLQLVFEFKGTAASFLFNSSQLYLNVVLLANVTEQHVNLDQQTPVVRITGDGTNNQMGQLMHLLRPDRDQIFADSRILVRRVAGDRFNQSTLLRLLQTIQGHLRTDFYAFQNLDQSQVAVSFRSIHEHVQRLIRIVSEKRDRSIAGTYLMLDRFSTANVNVGYLVTSGAAVNEDLTTEATFSVTGGLDANGTKQIAQAIPGTDEIKTDGNHTDLMRYALISGDRIVTSVDIKAFCYKEMMLRYSIGQDMIANITVAQEEQLTPTTWHNACGFEIRVEITLIDSPNLRKNFTERIPQAEVLLEKMMQVRSANIYPINVIIKIQE